MISKKDIRAQVRLAFAGRTAAELASASAAACAAVRSYIDSMGKPGMTILLYWSLPDEVRTEALAEELRSEGHTVLLPVVIGEEMILRVFHGTGDMVPGPFGILEPQGPEFTDYGSIDLAIVPGRAFTASGDRLGRGRGYYDKFLPLLKCPRAGLCYPWQIVPAIPTDPHDIPMDVVLTSKQL